MAIPLSYLVSIMPGVLSAGVSANSLYALMLSNSATIPSGGVLSFYSAASVGELLGYDSAEYASAQVFFSGFVNSPRKPTVLYVSRLASTTAAASLIGAASSTTLAQFQALTSPSMTISIDGTSITINPSFANATSLSGVASIVQTALGTGTVVYNSGLGGFIITGSTGTTNYTVSSVTVDAGGTGYAVGDTVTFTGGKATVSTIGTGGVVTALTIQSTTAQTTDPAGTGLTTTTNGSGTGLTVTTTSTSTETGIPSSSAVSYATGTLATAMGLTQTAGAVQSTAVLDTDVASQMDTVRAANGMWSHFFCAFDPGDQKTALAAWGNTQNDDAAAIIHDTAVTTAQIAASTSWGQSVTTAGYEGVAVVALNPLVAALIASVPCSVDWTAAKGRYNVAFRRSSSITPDVTDGDTATAFEGAGYNFYGQVAGQGVSYNGVYPGCVSGEYSWLDSYFNQIWMRRNFQLNLVDMLFNIGQIPYTTVGDAYIESALKTTIDAALNFGAIQSGVTLSDSQTETLTQTYGTAAVRALQLNGYYLYVNSAGASATVRAARQTPDIYFYYTDGQSLQRISMNSIEVA